MMPQPSNLTRKSTAAAARFMSLAPKQLRVALRQACLLAASAVLVFIAISERSMAQNRPSAEPAKGVQILLLGTHGGPSLDKDRSEPSSLLIVDGRPYLIDCGIGTMRRLLGAGVRSETIGTIFITHNHPDHALGLVDVMSNDFLHVDFSRAPASAGTFNIYGPPQTADLVNAAYNYIRIPYGVFAAEDLGASTLVNPFKAHNIEHDGLVYQDDKIRVAAAENTHYQLMAAKYRTRMKSYAYRFETPYGAIVFTGDTGPSDAVARLAKGADVLVSEVADLGAMPNAQQRRPGTNPRPSPNASALTKHMQMEHLPMKDVGEMASKAGVKAVLLHHFVPANHTERFITGVKKYYSGPVYAGEDLARYCLGTPDGKGSSAGTLSPCR
jgi:ribonuclease BN (tRNA processing enzyme)